MPCPESLRALLCLCIPPRPHTCLPICLQVILSDHPECDPARGVCGVGGVCTPLFDAVIEKPVGRKALADIMAAFAATL